MEDDLGAIPSEVVEAYSTYLDERIELLGYLWRDREKEEALTLCCVYIESLAQKLYGAGDLGSKWKFVRATLDFGGNQDLSLIHLHSLAEALRGCGRDHSKLEGSMKLQGNDRLSTEEEVIAGASSSLNSEQLKLLRDNIWHGTVAAQMYRHFRNPLVHTMDATDGVILGGVTFRGFDVLYPVLQRIAIEYKKRLAGAQCLSS